MRYKKIITYYKNPNYENLIGGILFALIGTGVLVWLFFNGETVVILVLVGMIAFGLKLIENGLGQGKKIEWEKIR